MSRDEKEVEVILAFDRIVADLRYLNHEQLINLNIIIGDRLNDRQKED
mgnify:FL=1|jgi:hypothetical protein